MAAVIHDNFYYSEIKELIEKYFEEKYGVKGYVNLSFSKGEQDLEVYEYDSDFCISAIFYENEG